MQNVKKNTFSVSRNNLKIQQDLYIMLLDTDFSIHFNAFKNQSFLS